LTRYTVAARSPLTGAFGEAEAGGFWGPELKMAGFDGVIIEGRSPKPAYLWIKDGKAEIRDAAKIWGKDTGEAERLIREELGDNRIRVAQCGPAGEKMVRYACVLNELKHANGRTGMGAVMGSKNLRAIAVRGAERLALANSEKVREIGKRVVELIKEAPLAQNFKKFGTPFFVMPLNNSGILPTRNFQSGHFAGAEAISGETMTDTILVKSEGCYACAVQCNIRPRPNMAGPNMRPLLLWVPSVALTTYPPLLMAMNYVTAGVSIRFPPEFALLLPWNVPNGGS